MIDENEIKKLAQLARIDIPEAEHDNLKKDLSVILEYVSQIQNVSTKPDFSKGDAEKLIQENRNVLREDTDPHDSDAYTEELLTVAPQTKDGYIKVKKIL